MNEPSDAPEGRRVAVLGGSGFIGSHVASVLAVRGFRVRAFGRHFRGLPSPDLVPAPVETIEGDAARVTDVLDAIGDADTVVHLIHTTVPGSSMADPAYDVTSNLAASVGWLPQLRSTRVRRILYVSSGGTVYGVPRSVPIDEDHPTEPISSYGITKLAMEKYVAMYAAMCGVEHCILRPSNVYGPGQRRRANQGIIGVMAGRALEGKQLEVWGDGTSQRDYLFVDDLVDAIALLVDYAGPHRVFNVSSGIGASVLDIVEGIDRRLGFRPTVTYLPERGFDVPVNVLDASRLREATGWRPRVDLETGIARTVDWLESARR